MIHKEDKEILAKLFNPGQVSYTVFDGQRLERTLVSEQSKNDEPLSNSLVFVEHGLCEDLTQDYEICILPKAKKFKSKRYKQFFYITNPDGTIRWLFPKDLKTPTFLSFYSVTTLKAQLFVLLCKLLFALHLQRFFMSGCFTVVSKQKIGFDELCDTLSMTGYSIFTGTVGKNRKAIIEFHQGKDVKYFYKMPFDKHSASIVDKERAMLKRLSQHKITQFEYPRVPKVELKIPGLLQENIALEDAQRVRQIDQRHLNFVADLHRLNSGVCPPNQCLYLRDVEMYFETIEAHDSIYLSDEILPKLKRLHQHLMAQESLAIAWAHADFVPWNTFANTDKLHVYDWELSNVYYPALFDVFHFVFQSGVLIDQASLDTIFQDLEKVYQFSEFKALKDKYKIDINTQLSAYLLLNVSHYLSIYCEQNRLHKQVYWLLNMWNKALDQVLENEPSQTSQRQLLIRSILHYLHEQDVDYAVLKIADKDLFKFSSSSDIDLVFRSKDVAALIENLKGFCYLKRMNVSRRSNLVTIALYLDDATFLSLDLVLAFKRREVVYLDAERLLQQRIFDNRGFYRLGYNDDLDYMLNFYILNGEGLPAHYRQYFLDKPLEVQNALLAHVEDVLGIKVCDLRELFEQKTLLLVNIKKKLRRNNQNRGLRRLKHIVQYLNDTQKMVRLSKGFILTLSGVDGAGKTTLLESTQDYLENTLRKQVVLLRLRPSVLPILSAYKYGKEEAEKRSMQRLPRQGTNTSVPKSLVRFMYYYLDYIIGQWMVYFKYLIRGKVVIYDRYYFDFINDARRMNLELPQWITKLGYRFIFKPRLNLFLYAQPEVILARKKELEGDTIKQLNERYLSLFDDFGKRYKKSEYVSIENEVLEDTETIIRDYINTIA